MLAKEDVNYGPSGVSRVSLWHFATFSNRELLELRGALLEELRRRDLTSRVWWDRWMRFSSTKRSNARTPGRAPLDDRGSFHSVGAPPPTDLSSFSTPIWKDIRTYVVIVALTVLLLCNITILIVTFRKTKVGPDLQAFSMGLKIPDDDIITVVQIFARILEAITLSLAGFALAQLWSGRLFRQDVAGGARLADLQTLGMFQSFAAMIRALAHIITGRFFDRTWIYIPLLISALILQLYPPALVSLAIPTLQTFKEDPVIFSRTDLPFMVLPYFATPCQPVLSDGDEFDDEVARSCLGDLFASGALADLVSFSAFNPFPLDWGVIDIDPQLWIGVPSTYSWASPNASYVLLNPLGPIDPLDTSAGSILFAQNFGVMHDLLHGGMVTSVSTLVDHAGDRPLISDAEVEIWTTVPILTAQCAASDSSPQHSPNVTIGNNTYSLPKAIQPLKEGEIVAQVTTDQLSIVVSIEWLTLRIDCATSMMLRNGTISITASQSRFDSVPLQAPLTRDGAAILLANGTDPLDVIVQGDNTRTGGISPFADIWLSGMGWSEVPTDDSVSSFISHSFDYIDSDASSNYSALATQMEKYLLTTFLLQLISRSVRLFQCRLQRDTWTFFRKSQIPHSPSHMN